jgi:Fuc2NAc and GlcNAc transferase
MGDLVLVAVVSFATSLLLSAVVLRYTRSRALLDVPTARSSHTRPTPRGGGLGMVLVVLAAVTLLMATDHLPGRTGIALLGGGTLVAAIGWLDDLEDISAAARLAAHSVAALWAVTWLGGMPTLTVGSEAVRLGAAGGVLAVVGVVWATNLYNFMDGIDGLAAGEAASVGLVGAMLLAPRQPALAAVAACVTGAAAGFLPWNWQPARVFMGDVGSGFLGFVIAALAVASENAGAVPALAWLLLLGIFFADATITLIRRMARRERWYAAHRGHAYQRATQAGWSHARVTSAVIVLNGVLAGLAWLGLRRPQLLPSLLLLAGALVAGIYLLVERWRPMARESPAGSMEKPVP